jgi:hypothetical protein
MRQSLGEPPYSSAINEAYEAWYDAFISPNVVVVLPQTLISYTPLCVFAIWHYGDTASVLDTWLSFDTAFSKSHVIILISFEDHWGKLCQNKATPTFEFGTEREPGTAGRTGLFFVTTTPGLINYQQQRIRQMPILKASSLVVAFWLSISPQILQRTQSGESET